MATPKHPARIAAGLVVLLGVVLVAAVASGVFRTPAPRLTPAQIAARAIKRLLAQEASTAKAADSVCVAVKIPVVSSRVVRPRVPAKLFRARLAPDEVLGYVPYWEAPDIPRPNSPTRA